MKKPMANIAALITPPPGHPQAKRLTEKKWPLVLIALMLLAAVGNVGALILGPAFIYHGRLQIGDTPVNGSYDLTFALYTNNSDGTAVAGPLTNSAITIHDGVFSARLD